MLTLDHYRAVWDNRLVWRALGNTLLLGLLGATATMVLGGLVAYVLVRTRFAVRRVLEILAWLPWMMPGMVLGVGFLWAYALLPGPIQLYGTLWALLVAYVTLGTPLAVRTMSGAFAQLAYDLEECSRVHGAAWWTTFRRILLALAWPSFAVGFILIFFVILRELSASILLYSVGNEVLAGRGHAAVDGGQGRPGQRDRARHARASSSCSASPSADWCGPISAGRDRPAPGRDRHAEPPSRPSPRRPGRALRRPGRPLAQAPGDAEWKKVIEAAKKEGKVVVYNGAVGTPALPKAGAAFEAQYGIRFELLEARASELRERIRTEQAAGKVLGDVSHNGSTTTALQLAEGTFQPYGALPERRPGRSPPSRRTAPACRST